MNELHWFSEAFNGHIIRIYPDGTWTAQRFRGHVIRIGPHAHRRPDPYVWAVCISDDGRWLMSLEGELLIPLTDDGEFGPVSTQKLNAEVVRTALEAAESLGFHNWRWRHKEKTMNKHKHAKNPDKALPDGTLDQATFKANVAAYNDAVQRGDVQGIAVGEPMPVPGNPGWFVKSFIVKE